MDGLWIRNNTETAEEYVAVHQSRSEKIWETKVIHLSGRTLLDLKFESLGRKRESETF
jgi:hypothetical protein